MTLSAPVAVHSTTEGVHTPDFIVRLQKKDLRAFTILYDNYSGALFALTYRATNNKSSAEDILHNVFMKVWANLPNYIPEKSGLYTWMMTITRNEIVDYYRLSGLKKRTATKSYQVDYTCEHEQEVQNKLDVKNILKALNTSQKLMLDLIYFKGYSFTETASLMRMPVGMVKTQVRTLLKKWRPTIDFLYPNS